jgi:hypothetical protein
MVGEVMQNTESSWEFKTLHLQKTRIRNSCDATLSKYNTLIKTWHRSFNAV